ncbi:MAG: hypothetical protein ACYCX4_09230 [Bacillota bacterium]
MRRRIVRILVVYLVGISIIGVWFAVNPKSSGDLRRTTSITQDVSKMLDLIKLILASQPQETQQGGNLPGTSSVYPVPKGNLSIDENDGNISRDPLRQNDTTVISGEKIGELENNVSLTDKLKVMNLLRKRLDPTDIQRLATLATGGITNVEKEEVTNLLHARLTAQEFTEVRQVLGKYIS